MYNDIRDWHLRGNRMGKHALPKCKIITFDLKINDIQCLPEDTLGDRVKKARLQKGMFIKDLAKLSKVSEAAIVYIEHGNKQPYISTLNKISAALGTSNRYLLGADQWPEDTPGQIIRKYRLINGWTQRQLATKSALDQGTILAYENDRNKVIIEESLMSIYLALGYRL